MTVRQLGLLRGVAFVVVAQKAAYGVVERVPGFPELVHSPPNLVSDLRELVRPEDEHSHYENDEQVPGRQKAFHGSGAYAAQPLDGSSR